MRKIVTFKEILKDVMSITARRRINQEENTRIRFRAETRTEGSIISLTDGIARLHGLSDVMQGEMIEFPNNVFGLALNLEQDSVGAVILGQYEGLSERCL